MLSRVTETRTLVLRLSLIAPLGEHVLEQRPLPTVGGVERSVFNPVYPRIILFAHLLSALSEGVVSSPYTSLKDPPVRILLLR